MIAFGKKVIDTRRRSATLPHFDEVVIVRAIGWQDPDNTIKIAKERGCKVGVYYNEAQKYHANQYTHNEAQPRSQTRDG